MQARTEKATVDFVLRRAQIIAQPIRVAAVPASHPYTRNVMAAAITGTPRVVTLPDPIPSDRPTGQWWPPVALDANWIAEHESDFDLMHLHFGLESLDMDRLERVVAALNAARRPFVFTVHDLVNPQLVDQTHHRAQLDTIIPRADAVITLTPGAAAEIEETWGRTATVIPHPAVWETDEWETDDLPGSGGDAADAVVAIHLKDIRPNVDAERAVATLVAAITGLRARGVAVRAEVHLDAYVRDADARAAVLRICDGRDGVTVTEHPRLSDHDLARSLASATACMLPYRFGTHSGWLELCWDLAVPVLAPDIGFYAQQHDETGSVVSFAPGSVESFSRAIAAVLENESRAGDRAVTRATRRATRRRQRNDIARRHLSVYREILADRRPA